MKLLTTATLITLATLTLHAKAYPITWQAPQPHEAHKDYTAMTALSAIEFNPDHKGLSVGLGMSSVEDTKATSLGVQYGIKLDTTSLGINVKAFKGQESNGFTTGITIGF